MKQPRCPKCKSSKPIPIVYGYPSRETEKKAIEGKIKLGGCCVGTTIQLDALTPDEDEEPVWHCRNCKRDWTDGEVEQGRPKPVVSTGPKRWHKGMRHTPGPWTLNARPWGFEVRDARGGVIARIEGRSWHTAEPNAYLITAAPKLFEILVKIVAHHKISPILREKEARLAVEAIANAQSWDD